MNINVYGALLNAGSRFFDQRLGQSVTLSGRNITRHMAAKTNEMITGEYDHYGKSTIYGDTDSVVGSSIIRTSLGNMTVEELFEKHCGDFVTDGDKEYGHNDDIMVMSYDPEIQQPYMGHINFVYRHEVDKDLYEVEDELGNVVTVTEDHSIIVERNGILVEVKPFDLSSDDVIISINFSEQTEV